MSLFGPLLFVDLPGSQRRTSRTFPALPTFFSPRGDSNRSYVMTSSNVAPRGYQARCL